jgi:hypothetical protein
MGKMGLPSFTINEEVIKEDKDKMMKKGLKDVIHETLESGWHITQAKGND